MAKKVRIRNSGPFARPMMDGEDVIYLEPGKSTTVSHEAWAKQCERKNWFALVEKGELREVKSAKSDKAEAAAAKAELDATFDAFEDVVEALEDAIEDVAASDDASIDAARTAGEIVRVAYRALAKELTAQQRQVVEERIQALGVVFQEKLDEAASEDASEDGGQADEGDGDDEGASEAGAG